MVCPDYGGDCDLWCQLVRPRWMQLLDAALVLQGGTAGVGDIVGLRAELQDRIRLCRGSNPPR